MDHSPRYSPTGRPYDDGLIVSDDSHRIYPEVAQQKSSPQPPPSTTMTNATMTPATIGGTPLPAEKAWSVNNYQQNDGYPAEGYRGSIWKRPITWVVIVALVVIAVLAGVLGGVVSGSIKTPANSRASEQNAQSGAQSSISTISTATSAPTASASSGSSTATSDGATVSSSGSSTSSTITRAPTSSAPQPTVSVSTTTVSGGLAVIWECPSANGVNYTTNASGSAKTFRRQCSVNYSGGEGKLGLQSDHVPTIRSMTECLDLCATLSTCVGAVFNAGPQCWLKETIGSSSTEDGTESAILWQ
ncbi:hypothetical protein B0T17DRAFT_505873 [Bombardia bombarda]|uniref:Apple domain-containing protein n=1 Tax=Bombardia bombarda TaxID=252184 RepID=A0AA39X8I8_9PEZI|nr:hypothetical protein B0T17DRAFT_505873 [Bombardia bombarda]